MSGRAALREQIEVVRDALERDVGDGGPGTITPHVQFLSVLLDVLIVRYMRRYAAGDRAGPVRSERPVHQPDSTPGAATAMGRCRAGREVVRLPLARVK